MQIKADSPDEYIGKLPPDRMEALTRLRKVIVKNLPEGFHECISYGMIGYVVPHSLFPAGYKSDPKLPLPFINIASQKNHVAMYHMGLYADSRVLKWFQEEYPNHSKTKLDMGKGCIRFKNPANIPYELIGELVSKISVKEWINAYETRYLNR